MGGATSGARASWPFFPRHSPSTADRKEAPIQPPPLDVRLHESITELPQASWDALLAEDSSPFLEWAWLASLEEAGCISPKRGWLPRHIGVWRGDALVGAAPAYVKGNSEGEFVFDHQWAALSERLGAEYYPKLILAVPFTPATGDRVLAAKGESREAMRAIVADAATTIATTLGLSSAHVLFPRDEEARAFERRGFARRVGLQFQWKNRGYSTFDDFLGSFDSKRRHQLRRERRVVAEQGITIETKRGDEIDDEVLACAYRFYLSTVDRFMWGRRYLNERFFQLIRDRLARGRAGDLLRPKRASLEIVVARLGGRIVGGAVNIAKNGRLYGRYWGADEQLRFLHFAVCYYHSIDECIARGFEAFEPGGGGEHKVKRGFDPTATFSAHHLRDPRLDRIVREFLPREMEHVERIVRGEIEDDDEE